MNGHLCPGQPDESSSSESVEGRKSSRASKASRGPVTRRPGATSKWNDGLDVCT